MKTKSILLLAVIAIALVIMPVSSNAVQTPNEATITFTEGQATLDDCVSAELYLLVATYTKSNTPEAYTVNVTLSEDLCSPIFPRAAIYSMPGNGVAWPQELVTVKEFKLQEAGTYSIRFNKVCGPQQFDVINGQTPQTIAPWGEWHGPLLFPLAEDSALQYWGSVCEETTTTVPESEVTTVPATVLGTTVTRPGDPGVKVAGINVSKTLPVTGTQSTFMVTIAFALITSGAIFFVVSRRRRIVVK